MTDSGPTWTRFFAREAPWASTTPRAKARDWHRYGAENNNKPA